MAPVDPEAQALSELDAQHRLDRVHMPNQAGWVAQLSTKYAGITDPHLTAANGTHTFYTSDILAEFRALQQKIGGSGAAVVLLRSSDYGTGRGHDGRDYWVTFALDDFSSSTAVHTWCAAQFPALSGDARTNACLPTLLVPR